MTRFHLSSCACILGPCATSSIAALERAPVGHSSRQIGATARSRHSPPRPSKPPLRQTGRAQPSPSGLGAH